MKLTITLFALVLGCLGASIAQTSSTEQTFCDDDAPQDLRLKPTALPHSVLTALMETKEVRNVQRFIKSDKKSGDMVELFRGATVSLGAAPDDTFLVIGRSPVSGADNTWFWIVRRSGEKATVLLWAGANCLTIEKSSNLGFRDIQTVWSSASESIEETYSFDGTAYKLTKKKSHPVN